MWQIAPTDFPVVDYPVFQAPRAVIYEDGSTISLVVPATTEAGVHREALARPLFVSQKLAAGELGAWYEDVLAIAQMEDLPREFTLDPLNSEPVVWFSFFAGSRATTVAIRGLGESSLDRFGTPRVTDPGLVPPRLLRLYQHLSRLGDASAAEWQPNAIELRFRPAHAPLGPTVSWPPSWATNSIQQRSDDLDSVSLLLDGSAHDRLVALLPAPLSQHAVRFEGRTMAIDYRFVFPGETAWRALWHENLSFLLARNDSTARDPPAALREHESLREMLRLTPSQVPPVQR